MFISASHCSCCVFLVHSLIASHDPVIIVFSVQVSINMWRIIPLTYRRAPFAVCSFYVHSAEVATRTVVHVSVTLFALFVCFFTILETQDSISKCKHQFPGHYALEKNHDVLTNTYLI